MAFQNKSEKKSAKSIVEALNVGESLTGYYLGNEVVTIEDREAHILKLRINGEVSTYFAAGNLRYLIIDGKLTEGQNTRITREKDGKNKKGARVSSFTVEQDPDDVIVGLEAATASSSAASTTSVNSGSSSIKDKLKVLQQQKQGAATT